MPTQAGSLWAEMIDGLRLETTLLIPSSETNSGLLDKLALLCLGLHQLGPVLPLATVVALDLAAGGWHRCINDERSNKIGEVAGHYGGIWMRRGVGSFQGITLHKRSFLTGGWRFAKTIENFHSLPVNPWHTASPGLGVLYWDGSLAGLVYWSGVDTSVPKLLNPVSVTICGSVRTKGFTPRRVNTSSNESIGIRTAELIHISRGGEQCLYVQHLKDHPAGMHLSLQSLFVNLLLTSSSLSSLGRLWISSIIIASEPDKNPGD